jgi:acyl-CoA thioester hydrolase
MLGPTHEYMVAIREHHLDTFGHVNNATYLDLFEEARWDLISRNGYGLDEVHRLKVGPTVLEVRVRFARELRNRQQVTIRTWLESYSGKIGKLAQQIRDEGGELCTDALFTIGLFDMTSRRLVRPTPEWIAALGLRQDELRRGE